MDGSLLGIHKSADNILGEIQSESLQHLLSSLRQETGPLGKTLFSPPEPASSFSFPFTLSRGHVIELQGPSCSGKTHLVYHLLIMCILPRTSAFQGWEKAAALLDVENDFSVERFRQLLRGRITRLQPSSDHDAIVVDCLSRLFVFRPKSSLQLAATLLNLPTYQRNHLPELDIGLIAIDSLSTFYWADKFTADQAQHRAADEAPVPPTLVNPLLHVLSSLKKIFLSHSPAVVLTNWGLYLERAPSETNHGQTRDIDPSTQFYKQHISPFPYASLNSSADGNGYTLPLTHHITLSTCTPTIHDTAPTADAQYSDQSVLEATSSRFQARVRTPGNTTLSRFEFTITKDEVILE